MKQKRSFQANAVVRWVQIGLNNLISHYNSIKFGKILIPGLYSCASALWKRAEPLRATMWIDGILIIHRWLLHSCMKCSHWCATNLHQLSFTVEVEFVFELRYHTLSLCKAPSRQELLYSVDVCMENLFETLVLQSATTFLVRYQCGIHLMGNFIKFIIRFCFCLCLWTVATRHWTERLDGVFRRLVSNRAVAARAIKSLLQKARNTAVSFYNGSLWNNENNNR